MKHSIVILFLAITLYSCVNTVARRPISRKSHSGMNASVKFNKSMNAAEEEVLKLFIKNDSLNTYIASPNGFWYTYNKKGKDTYLPEAGDGVQFEFEVSNIDKSVIYGREELGAQEYFIDEQEIVEGLRHGLKLMSTGDNVTFLFPSHMMYGYGGDQHKIGINQPLIYRVQLNKINRKNESN